MIPMSVGRLPVLNHVGVDTTARPVQHQQAVTLGEPDQRLDVRHVNHGAAGRNGDGRHGQQHMLVTEKVCSSVKTASPLNRRATSSSVKARRGANSSSPTDTRGTTETVTFCAGTPITAAAALARASSAARSSRTVPAYSVVSKTTGSARTMVVRQPLAVASSASTETVPGWPS